MTVMRYAPFALTPSSAYPEMTSVAVLPASRLPGTVLMPFIVDDEFHVFARVRSLPPCALSFLMLAGSWSARESRSGFVPNSILADFSDDFATAERTLCSAGILRRVKAGVRIVEGRGLTVVNAKDVSRDIERDKAEAEERREGWRAKKQRQRAEQKAARQARITADFPVLSPKENADVPPENPGNRGKPQVSMSSVPGDNAGTSRGTKTPSRVRARPDDFDSGQSQGVSQSKSDARASDADDPELVTVVANAICAVASFLPGDDQARAVIRIYEDRARKAGTVIRDKPAYYAGSVRKEPDLWNGILLPKPPPAAELRPPVPAPGSWADPFTPRPDPDRSHEFDPIIGGVVCQTCNRTERNPLHATERLA